MLRALLLCHTGIMKVEGSNELGGGVKVNVIYGGDTTQSLIFFTQQLLSQFILTE